LRESVESERLKTIEPKFQEAMRIAETIPLRNKTQYPLYLEARSLTMLRAIAEYDDVSVQELIRSTLEGYVADRIVKHKKKRPRKKVTKRGG
jgi:hypothetical protein